MDQVKYTNKLRGARVLVLGGSSGIGYGAAEAFVEHGAVVTISSSSSTRVSAAVAKLQAAYPSAKARISGQTCDLSDAGKLEANVEALFAAVGPLDHVVHTAGDAIATGPLADFDVPRIQAAGMIRFVGSLVVAKVAVRYLTPGPRASITLTGGGVADRPQPGWAVQNGYMAGLCGLARGLALDLKPVRVNLILPGPVDTELWDAMGLDQAAKDGMRAQVEKVAPTGRMGRVEDLAETYLGVLKDENMTGSVVGSNAGMLLV